jgi:hypothetical protein
VKSLLVISILISLGVAIGIGNAALAPGSRVPTWLGGAGDLSVIEAQVAELEAEVAVLEKEADLLQSDPFAIEKAIREDLRMAKSGEVVIHLRSHTRPNPRFP